MSSGWSESTRWDRRKMGIIKLNKIWLSRCFLIIPKNKNKYGGSCPQTCHTFGSEGGGAVWRWPSIDASRILIIMLFLGNHVAHSNYCYHYCVSLDLIWRLRRLFSFFDDRDLWLAICCLSCDLHIWSASCTLLSPSAVIDRFVIATNH